MKSDTIVLLQARMSSSRLPGKMLKPICGTPLIDWVVTQAGRAHSVGLVVVATSSEPSDDPLAERVSQLPGTRLFRGSLENVYGRFADALNVFECARFVRVNGDSPLIDPRIIDHAVSIARAKADVDVVTNVMPRSFPPGQSVEVIRSEAFSACRENLDNSRGEHEHITQHFYNNRDRFKIENFTAHVKYDLNRYCIDDLDDFTMISDFIAKNKIMPGDFTVFRGASYD